jgi:hypothetical protein
MTTYQITPSNTYSADETGLGMGVSGIEQVLGAPGQKIQYQQRSGA